MAKAQSKQTGFGSIELIIVIVVIGVLGVTGWLVYQHTRANISDTTSSTYSTSTAPPAPDLYAGWKTYTLAEDDTISFKYPADWTVVADAKDASSTPYNHFFKIVDPNLYHGNDFVFIFRYSPGQSNQLTKECSAGPDTTVAKSEYLTIGNKKVRLVTRAFAIDGIQAITMALTDASNSCYVSVPSGVIEATENLGSESAPTYSIDLNVFNALPEGETFNLIFKSIKF